MIWRENHAPFGEARQRPVANDNAEGFTGHVADAATGLVYMQARYYDPAIGRFLSSDPVGFAQGGPGYFNRYAYVMNDPVNHFDPTGEQVAVRLEGYPLRGPVGTLYGHSYVRATDTNTGESYIFRGGPSANYPGGMSEASRGQGYPGDANGVGRVSLVTETRPAAASIDTLEPASRGITPDVIQSKFLPNESIENVRNQFGVVESSLNQSDFVYQPRVADSNFADGLGYQAVTGENVEPNRRYPAFKTVPPLEEKER